MYIKNLEKYTADDWQNFFEKHNITYPWIKTEMKKVLTLSKKHIERRFKFLENWWILNGIWPKFFPQWLVNAITYLFPYVKWEMHDLGLEFAENEKDRLKADRGLFKYTMVSIHQKTLERLKKGGFILLSYDFIAIFFKNFIAYLFYILVRIFWRFSINYK